ncbi:MAG: maleylacetoacetate isomerase [Polyangiaceae bacterium]|nr:maleylacetoacetate isomerase [Polyangiaceae bacterium]
MKLRLHSYWRSSSAYRVRIGLAIKGLEYETVPVNLLASAQTAEAYRSVSPMGHVPCLEIDGEPFVESVAILQLLDALCPGPRLFPEDPRQRAHLMALVEIVNSGTQPLQNLVVLNRLPEDGRRAWGAHFIGRGLGAFEALMEQNAARGVVGPFAFGAELGAADAFLVPQVYNARRFGVDLAAYPRVAAAEAAAVATVPLRAAHPDVQPDAPPPAAP